MDLQPTENVNRCGVMTLYVSLYVEVHDRYNTSYLCAWHTECAKTRSVAHCDYVYIRCEHKERELHSHRQSSDAINIRR